MAEGTKDRGAGIDGYLFRLIATFEAAAMQQLGKIAHPVTGDVEVSLEGARDSIEMLAMVQRKTEGNLNEDEGRLLQHVLYQLRMNYVDVARDDERTGTEPAGDSGAEPEGDGGGAAADATDDSGAEPEGDNAVAAADAGSDGEAGDTSAKPEPTGDSKDAEAERDDDR
jgi:hypothetical protein